MRAMKKIGVVTAALLMTLTGCAVTGTAGTTTAQTPAPVLTAPIPVLTVATPKPRTPAPALKNTGVRWPAILASLSGYGQWVLANPDPALVGAITEPGCAMANLLAQQASGLLGDHAYLKPVPPVFLSVTGPSPAAGNAVTLSVSASRPQEAVLSRTGNKPITAFAALPVTDLRITLYRGPKGGWRLCTVDATADSGWPDDPSLPLF
jgi:hypothetical protein